MTLSDYIDTLRGKQITVIGAGISNRPLIRLLCENRIDVTVCDKAEALHKDLDGLKLKAVLGPSYLDALEADVIFRTPGLHPFHPALQKAMSKGSQITSEMEVFLHLCPCRVIAVTGSDGKTTTTTLISEILKQAGYKVHLGGNIGQPLLCQVSEMKPEDMVVLELSSFQLHSMQCCPDIAVITNLAPNHLDVHPDYADYIAAKKQIFLHQADTGMLVLNADNADTAACAPGARGTVRFFSRKNKQENGVYLTSDGSIVQCLDGAEQLLMAAEDILLPGVHNIENMMAAFAATADFADTESLIQVAKTFTGVAHRLEKIRTLRGVTFINDSIASSPSRTIAGLGCFKDKLILIAGGKDKGVPFDSLGPVICDHVKELYLTGFTAGKIKAAVEAAANYHAGQPDIHIIDDFRQCVESAAEEAKNGDIVLLSPASTSFDHFKNFEERGNYFRKIVEELQ